MPSGALQIVKQTNKHQTRPDQKQPTTRDVVMPSQQSLESISAVHSFIDSRVLSAKNITANNKDIYTYSRTVPRMNAKKNKVESVQLHGLSIQKL